MISRQGAKTKYKKTPRLCGLADLGPLARNLRIERTGITTGQRRKVRHNVVTHGDFALLLCAFA